MHIPWHRNHQKRPTKLGGRTMLKPLLLGVVVTALLMQLQGVYWTIPAHSSAHLADLDVLYIERLPKYDYDDATKVNPGWPDAGEVVQFRAYVKNQGSVASGFTNYKWYFDGVQVDYGGMSSVQPGEIRPVDYVWSWQQAPHTVKIIADVDASEEEISETNNEVEVITNSLGVGFWVEQSYYDWTNDTQFDLCQPLSCAGSNSFEDWAQRQMDSFNSILATSYPSEPQGAVDRVHLDKVVIVADGVLPLNCGAGAPATNQPDCNDKTVDMMWGFPEDALLDIPFLEGIANLGLGFSHELIHQRYLIDMYKFDVLQTDVLIEDEQGNLVAGTPLMPLIPGTLGVHDRNENGHMGTSSLNYFSEHSVRALNLDRIVGKRSIAWEAGWDPVFPVGQLAHPGAAIGRYLTDVPVSNTLQVVTPSGQPLAGANVRVFQGKSVPPFEKQFLNTPDLQGVSNSQGLFDLGSFPFEGTLIDWNTGSGQFIIELTCGRNKYYEFREVTEFNLAYWNGNTQSATYTIEYDRQDADCDGFSDRPPTNIPTTTSTPQNTSTSEPTIPPEPTDTPPPLPALVGDANCDGIVDPIDAALILQFDSALLGALPCPDSSDVNRDGNINAIDAALVLQFAAGLLNGLPP